MHLAAFLHHVTTIVRRWPIEVVEYIEKDPFVFVCSVIGLPGALAGAYAWLSQIELRPRYEATAKRSLEYARRASKEVHKKWKGAASLTEAEYWQIVQHNEDVLISILDCKKDNRMVAFFDVFPIEDKTAEAFIAGKMNERALLTVNSVLDAGRGGSAKYIYLGSVLAFAPPLRGTEKLQLEFSILPALLKYIREKYPPFPGRVYFALGASRLGDRWHRHCGFTPQGSPDKNKTTQLVYVLASEELAMARHKVPTLRPHGDAELLGIRCSWKARAERPRPADRVPA